MSETISNGSAESNETTDAGTLARRLVASRPSIDEPEPGWATAIAGAAAIVGVVAVIFNAAAFFDALGVSRSGFGIYNHIGS